MKGDIISDECIISPLNKDKDGYPRLKHQGKMQIAGRLLWKIMYGEIPEGMLICHHCDNTSCVNPKHLYLGTFRDNMDDKIKEKRVAGDNHPRYKITDKQVLEIREMYDKGLYTQDRLATIYDVSQSQISAYVTGKRRTTAKEDNR